jgi:hypothetical protein
MAKRMNHIKLKQFKESYEEQIASAKMLIPEYEDKITNVDTTRLLRQVSEDLKTQTNILRNLKTDAIAKLVSEDYIVPKTLDTYFDEKASEVEEISSTYLKLYKKSNIKLDILTKEKIQKDNCTIPEAVQEQGPGVFDNILNFFGRFWKVIAVVGFCAVFVIIVRGFAKSVVTEYQNTMDQLEVQFFEENEK